MPVRALHLRLFRPFERFFRLEAAGGIVLLAATLLALAWANSRFFEAYFGLWSVPAVIGAGDFRIEKALLLWVNDGLMAIFFLLVGLEIKREFISGELSDIRAATLPIVAAIGGMIVPALIYAAVTRGTPASTGWGIPMATDIAFALGALAVLARRLPLALRIFLAATAIVDDVGAVLVIALVYTPSISMVALGVAALALLTLILFNAMGVRRVSPYLILGIVLWVAVLKSGVHATIAGVALALVIPARVPRDSAENVDEAEEYAHLAETNLDPSDRAAALRAAEDSLEEAQSPLLRLEHGLVPWVTFGIIPIFALANAGVRLEGSLLAALAAPVSLGIVLGLVIGKQIGLLVFPWLAIRSGLASLPAGVTWRHMWGVAWLAGIGFTMSLFIAGLGLPPEDLERAKLAILTASVLAAIGGLITLATAKPARVPTRTSR